MFRWILGGIIGGAIGVAVWVAVGYTTNYEVGYIAWGIGFLVGFGVRYASQNSDQEEGIKHGIVAAAIAAFSIVLAKYIVFSMILSKYEVAKMHDLARNVRVDDEAMIAGFAKLVVEVSVKNGEALEWPEGMTVETAERKQDFPPQTWEQAEAMWKNIGPEAQKEAKLERTQMAAKLKSLLGELSFSQSFSPWDFLWFGLAVFTAFKIGSGSYGEG